MQMMRQKTDDKSNKRRIYWRERERGKDREEWKERFRIYYITQGIEDERFVYKINLPLIMI